MLTDRRVARAVGLLVSLLVLAVGVASGTGVAEAQNRVAAINLESPVAVGAAGNITAGHVGFQGLLFDDVLLGCCVAPSGTLRGSGPVSGVLEASPRVRSVSAINNWNGKPVEFVFDPGTGTFAMGRPAASAGLKGSPHQQLACSINANPDTVVGGIVSRGPNGALRWNEDSGHYWRNWNDSVRQQFVDMMRGYGVNI